MQNGMQAVKIVRIGYRPKSDGSPDRQIAVIHNFPIELSLSAANIKIKSGIDLAQNSCRI